MNLEIKTGSAVTYPESQYPAVSLTIHADGYHERKCLAALVGFLFVEKGKADWNLHVLEEFILSRKAADHAER